MKAAASLLCSGRSNVAAGLSDSGEASSCGFVLLRESRLLWSTAALRAEEKRFLSPRRLFRDGLKSSSSEVSEAVKWSRKMAVGGVRAEVG